MHLRRFLAYAAIYLLWGATFLAVRKVVLVTPPFAAAGLRFTLSGLFLLALSRGRGEPWPTCRDWRNSTKLGFVMFTLNYACFFWAEQRLYSGIASVIVAIIPVWIMLADRLLTGRRSLTGTSLAGAALGIAGVSLVALGGAGTVPASNSTGLATCVLLTGTLCWSFGTVWSRTLQLPVQQTMRAALQLTSGGALLAVLALAAGEGPAFVSAVHAWTLTIWLCFAYLVTASIVAFTSYVWLLQHEPANRVASYAYANPVVALALGIGLAHERIGPWQVLGFGLVLSAVFAALRSQPHAPSAPAIAAKSI